MQANAVSVVSRRRTRAALCGKMVLVAAPGLEQPRSGPPQGGALRRPRRLSVSELRKAVWCLICAELILQQSVIKCIIRGMIKISDNIFNVGVNDHKIKFFEGQYPVPFGMAYNSYVILDEKIAVTDTVDRNFGHEWLENLEKVLKDRQPDYLIVHHMEPDHSANIAEFLNKYSSAKVVLSAVAVNILKAYFGDAFNARLQTVKEGDCLELGLHTLRFIGAPMVHWPEVLMSYETSEKVLFSADGFGSFGANDVDTEEYWDDEARRYYYGIVGKFGTQVLNVLKKAAALEIKTICSLHGPVLTGDLSHHLEEYTKWASYESENDGVFIPFTSVYGHTEEAVNLLAEKLRASGKDVKTMNLAENDLSYALDAAFLYKNVVFATTTYNTGIYPFMNDLITRLVEHGFCKTNVAFIENGSWAPSAARIMKEKLSECKELNFIEPVVTVKGALNTASKEALNSLSEKLK